MATTTKLVAIVLVPAILGLVGYVGAGSPKNPEVDEVRRVIESAIGWAVEKDFEKMFSIWAQDENLFHHWSNSKSTTQGLAGSQVSFPGAWRVT